MSGKIVNQNLLEVEIEKQKQKYYIDKGSELTDYYCPSGFRFLTNTEYIGPDGFVVEYAMDLIRNCWKYYDSVAVGPAFACNGFMMHNMIAIYVKQAEPLEFGTVCDYCKKYYGDNDIIQIETNYRDVKQICKNCFSVYSYEEIMVGNKIVLVVKYKYTEQFVGKGDL